VIEAQDLLIGAFALYARGRERWKKNEFTTYNLMADAGLILSPLVGLALLTEGSAIAPFLYRNF